TLVTVACAATGGANEARVAARRMAIEEWFVRMVVRYRAALVGAPSPALREGRERARSVVVGAPPSSAAWSDGRACAA
ncbi:MAG: hypothetical protein RIR65_1564, partial [Planctomycetota bacterium]